MDSREQTSWVFRHIGPPPTIAGSAEVIELKPGSTVFGRGGAADVYIDSKVLHNFISRCHAVVEGKKDDAGHLHFTLHNHGLNGTYVNDVRVGDIQQLQEGDVVIFGHKNGYKVKVGEKALQPDSEFQFVFERCHPAKSSCVPLQEHRQQEEANGGDATLSVGEHSNPSTYTPRRNPPTLTREATQQYKGSPTKKEKGHDFGNTCQGHSESSPKKLVPQTRPDHLTVDSGMKEKVNNPTRGSPKDKSVPRKVSSKDKPVLGKGSAKDKGVARKDFPRDVSITDQPKENKGRSKTVQSKNPSNDDVSVSFQHRPGKDSPKQRPLKEDQHDTRPASPKSHLSAAVSFQHSGKQLLKSKSSQQVVRERTIQGTDKSGSQERSRSPRPTGRSRPSSSQGSEYRSRSPLCGESSERPLSPHRVLVDKRSRSLTPDEEFVDERSRSPASDSECESDVYDEPPVLSPEAEYIRTPSLRSHSPCSYTERVSCDEMSDEADDIDHDSELGSIPLTPGRSMRDLSPSPHNGRRDDSPPAGRGRQQSPGEASPCRNDNSWSRGRVGETGFSRNQKGGKCSVSPYRAGQRGKEAEAECASRNKRDCGPATYSHRHLGKASPGPHHSTMEPDSTTVPRESNFVSSDSSNGRLNTPKRNSSDWSADSSGRFSTHQRNCEHSEDNGSRLKTQRSLGDEPSESSVDRLKTNQLNKEDERFKAHMRASSNQKTKGAAGKLKPQKTVPCDRQADNSVSRVKAQNKGLEEHAKDKHVLGSDVREEDRKGVVCNGQDRTDSSRGTIRGRCKMSVPPSTIVDRNVFDDFSSDILDSTRHAVGKRIQGSGSEVSGDDSSRPKPKTARLQQQSYKSFREKENGVTVGREASSVNIGYMEKMKDHRQSDAKLLKDVRVSVQRVSSSNSSDSRGDGPGRSKPPSRLPKESKPANRSDSERREPAMDTSLFGLEMERLGSMRFKDKVRTSKTPPDKGSKLSKTPNANVSSSEKQRGGKSHREKSAVPSPSQAPSTQFSSRTVSADHPRPGRKVAVRRPRELKDGEGYKSPLQQTHRGGGEERDSKKPSRPSSKRRKRQPKRTETEDEEDEDECLEDGVVWYDGESCESRDCMRPADRRVQWVCCDDCDKWYHTVCVGIMNLDDLADEDYHCGCAD